MHPAPLRYIGLTRGGLLSAGAFCLESRAACSGRNRPEESWLRFRLSGGRLVRGDPNGNHCVMIGSVRQGRQGILFVAIRAEVVKHKKKRKKSGCPLDPAGLFFGSGKLSPDRLFYPCFLLSDNGMSWQDRIDRKGRRQKAEDKMQNAKCKMQNAKGSTLFAFCLLPFIPTDPAPAPRNRSARAVVRAWEPGWWD
jgi:hypothetical protein